MNLSATRPPVPLSLYRLHSVLDCSDCSVWGEWSVADTRIGMKKKISLPTNHFTLRKGLGARAFGDYAFNGFSR